MGLLGVPPEILQDILIKSVVVRGLKRGVRLRLVNKLFSKEVIWAISKSGVLDDHCSHSYQGLPPGEYILHKALEKSESTSPGLGIIRRTADRLCSATNRTDENTRRAYVVELCSLAVRNRKCIMHILSMDENYIDGDGMVEHDMRAHVMTAASYLNMPSVVQQMIEQGGTSITRSSCFGNPVELAASEGNNEVLSILLGESYQYPKRDSCSRYSPDLLLAAAEAGHLETVRILLQPNYSFSYDKESRRKHLHKALRTPNLEVFELIMTAIVERPGSTRWHLSGGVLERLFRSSVWEGWIAMAIYLLDRGASVDSCRQNSIEAPFISSSPLAHACRTGKSEMVRLLLNRGVNASYAISYAAGGGHLGIVRMLLDHGCDPNEGNPKPVAWAVYLEHETMFRLLRERGAGVFLPSTVEDVVARSKGAGLDSMLKLLASEGVDINSVSTSHVPVRKLCFSCEPRDDDEDDN